MRASAWLGTALAVGGCAVAIANSPSTHNQPLFQPNAASVPHPQGGGTVAPSKPLGLPDSQIPSATQTNPSQSQPSASQAAKIATASSPAGLSGFAACWWKYYHGLRKKSC